MNIEIEQLYQSAVQYHVNGQLTLAERLYQQILELSPEHPKSLHLLGVLCSQSGRLPMAIALIQRAIEYRPNEAEFHSNLGLILTEQGDLPSAIQSLQQAIAINPGFVEAHNNLGNVLMKEGRLDEAAACYRRAVSISPTFAIAHYNLGTILSSQGAWPSAIESLELSLSLDSNFAEAHNNLGNARMAIGQFEAARNAFRSALQLQPDYADAHKNLGNAYLEEGTYDQAIECFRQAVRLSPTVADLSLAYLQQHVCDWDGLEVLAERIVARVADPGFEAKKFPINPFSFLCLPIPTTAEQQLRVARVWASKKCQSIRDRSMASNSTSIRDRESTSKFRVGYLSADFREHATAYLAVELFEAHNRERFEIMGYSIGPTDSSSIRNRLVASFDTFRDLSPLSFIDAANLIRSDRIDILVDLKGYTHRSRPEILALRPAPIQVNFLGYPGTMGADFIDYLIADEIVAPRELEACFTEKMVYLPGCFQVNDGSTLETTMITSRSDVGLPEHGFIFCAFNSTYKLTPKMFDVWMRLLASVPNSYLWLLESNRFAAANLRRETSARRIALDRIIFAPTSDHASHLARHRLADLFLDCYPVNAHTSASDALRMGLPLLTLCGQTFASRVAASLLHAVGLPEMIAHSLDEYEQLALRLATSPQQLPAIREKLARNLKTSTLFDGRNFASKIEVAYEAIHSATNPHTTTVVSGNL